MNKGIKDDIKKIAKETEVKLTGLLLKWKDQKEGKAVSDPDVIDKRSRVIADKANEIVKRRGTTILKEFKNVYVKQPGKEDDSE